MVWEQHSQYQQQLTLEIDGVDTWSQFDGILVKDQDNDV